MTLDNTNPSPEESRRIVENFYPREFDAKKWARLAKAAGMKYAVLTTKHHDGFCMFDSKLTDYKISVRFDGRDVFGEFVDAFRAEGIKVGFYYSLIDWHHPDYPPVGNHPLKGDSAYAAKPRNWSNYLKYMHGQVEELVKNYGKIDIAWFDFSFDEFEGEKWGAAELVKMIRKYQPSIIINNRLQNFSFTQTTNRIYGTIGDFETPEQGIPEDPIRDKWGNDLPWESCITLNNGWAFNPSDHVWKTPELIVQTLINCVSKNGNLLVNVGPDGLGNIPPESISILSAVGKWMDNNSESIYGCGAAGLPKPDWGRLTSRGNILYAHWMNPTIGPINIRNIGDRVRNTFLLANGSDAIVSRTLWINPEKGNFFMNVAKPVDATFEKPDLFDTVFKIILTQ